MFSPLQVHQETFGRSGCRRIVPGQYVAADPKGRACIIGAVEKQKFVYVLNRDSAANLTISSPLEAHKSHNIVFSMCALDCGFDNPIFAAIELDYADADQVGPRAGGAGSSSSSRSTNTPAPQAAAAARLVSSPCQQMSYRTVSSRWSWRQQQLAVWCTCRALGRLATLAAAAV
jgi:hypothetical protein